MKMKKGKLYAVVVMMATVALIACLYCIEFQVPKEEESMVSEIEELMGIPVDIIDIQEVNDNVFVSCINNKTQVKNGVAQFEKGWNGKLRLKRVDMISGIEPISVANFDIDGEYTAFYSVNCPEEIGSFQVTYYDEKAYGEGKIIEKTETIQVTEPHFLKVMPISFHFYSREIGYFDREGKALSARDFYSGYSFDGESKGAGTDQWSVYSSIIFLAGLFVAWRLWKREK